MQCAKETGWRLVPLYPAESRLSVYCREKAALHPAGLRSTGGWGRSGLGGETETLKGMNIYCVHSDSELNKAKKASGGFSVISSHY